MVALSLTRDKLDITSDINLNQIYQDLIEAVYERGYERGRLYRPIHPIQKADFICILEEIALSTWHGDGRTTSVREIHEHCRISGILPLFNIFQEGAKAGVTRLLSAFYFRRKGMRYNGEQAFEFTHKSFGEYLTARRMVHGIQCMVQARQRKQQDPYAGLNEKDCLKYWAELCGPAPIDKYLLDFISREMKLQDKNMIKSWQEILCQLMGFMLKHGIPMDQISRKLDFKSQTEHDRNAKEALLVALNSAARVTRRVVPIKWPESKSAGELLAQLQGQRIGPKNVVAFHCLSFLDLSDCIFDFRDLYRANLENSNFESSRLIMSILMLTNLKHANLKKASLNLASISYANFEGANLQRANLAEARFDKVNLKNANLKGANLSKAYFNKVDFEGANLEMVNFKDVKFNKVYLCKANLHKAKNLDTEELLKVLGLYKATLDPILMEKVKKAKPDLFKKVKKVVPAFDQWFRHRR